MLEPILYLIGVFSLLAGCLYFARKFETYGENNEKLDILNGILEDEEKARNIRNKLNTDNEYSTRLRKKYTR